MSGRFLDSNVFVYLFDDADPAKRAKARELVADALESRGYAISFQVVQEVLNVLTSKLVVPLTAEDARAFLDQVLVPLWRVMPSRDLYGRALDLQLRYRFSFYDSLVVAAALEEGCSVLYSEDLHAGQRIEGLEIRNPFPPR